MRKAWFVIGMLMASFVGSSAMTWFLADRETGVHKDNLPYGRTLLDESGLITVGKGGEIWIKSLAVENLRARTIRSLPGFPIGEREYELTNEHLRFYRNNLKGPVISLKVYSDGIFTFDHENPKGPELSLSTQHISSGWSGENLVEIPADLKNAWSYIQYLRQTVEAIESRQ